MPVDLTSRVGGLTLKNPVTVASGTFGYGLEFADFYDPGVLGGIFLKGLTVTARSGNAPPRLVETPSGLINSIGLQNIGIDDFVDHKWRELEHVDSAICANISGNTIDEFVSLAAKAGSVPIVRAIELNISCPNVKQGGVEFGRSATTAGEITRRCVEVSRVPVLVKLTPNVTDPVEVAAAAMDAGATGVTLVNTFLAMAIDAERRRPVLANVFGGLSGPAIKPIALRMVWQGVEGAAVSDCWHGGYHERNRCHRVHPGRGQRGEPRNREFRESHSGAPTSSMASRNTVAVTG